MAQEPNQQIPPRQQGEPQTQPQQAPQQPAPEPAPAPASQPRNESAAPAPIRKKGIGVVPIVAGVILLVLLAVVFLVIVPSCTKQGGEGGSTTADNIEVIDNGDDSEYTAEELVDRARSRYAGTWAITSIISEDGEASGADFPQNVAINDDGTCTFQHSAGDVSGTWAVDGGAIIAKLKAEDGTEYSRYLSIDDIQMTISVGSGTATYVRTSKGASAQAAQSAQAQEGQQAQQGE